MNPSAVWTFELDTSTLGELRALVAGFDHHPASTQVRVRTRLGGANRHGVRLRSVTVVGELPPTRPTIVHTRGPA